MGTSFWLQQNVHVLLGDAEQAGQGHGPSLPGPLDRRPDLPLADAERHHARAAARGRQVIQHQERGITIHLFVRPHKLQGKKAAPFTYFGELSYKEHSGSGPMSVVFDVPDAGTVQG
ncbi:MAG: hypothetical protein U5R48_18995 [Gammaproteobacteria bacterium]|nr:hypothetical protein [Gammaproteobacteria bacterium]